MAAVEAMLNLPAPNHMGIVVKDMDKAVQYYSSLFGWGPFQVREIDLGKFPGFSFRGEPATGRFKAAIGRNGSMVVELFQALEGESPYAEFARTRGEGLHHLGYQLDEINSALAALKREGIEPIFEGKTAQGAFAYFDTDRVGGIVIEILTFRVL